LNDAGVKTCVVFVLGLKSAMAFGFERHRALISRLRGMFFPESCCALLPDPEPDEIDCDGRTRDLEHGSTDGRGLTR
jgi:hypothetical protein